MTLENVSVEDQSDGSPPALAPGDYIHLAVSDTGQGIDPVNLEKIFDPYFTTKRLGEGTGMGLAVVRGIVASHRGAVTVHSHIGRGTTFHVHLPLAGEAAAQESESPQELPTGAERILFIDDEEGLVRAYAREISNLGYDVIPFTSSRQALEAFGKESDCIDLVITDMTMPEMTGDKLAKELQKIRPNIPIIICTGHSERLAEGTVRELGIAGYALKPIVKKDIAVTIRRILDGGS